MASATFLSGPAHSSGAAQADSRPSGSISAARAAATTPALRVTRVVGGLDIPWDVKRLPGGRLLITERTTKRLLTWRKGRLRVVAFPSSMVWASGETGLMSLAVDPHSGRTAASTPARAATAPAAHDVRVVAWRLNDRATRARFQRTLRSGLPATSGRHGGCRLLIHSAGALIVGTGDAAVGTNPRNLLVAGRQDAAAEPVHRRPVAQQPVHPLVVARPRATCSPTGTATCRAWPSAATARLWSVEHGPDRDDEVNRLASGGDYGWNPVPGYNESVPMTDHDLPGTQSRPAGAPASPPSPPPARPGSPGAAWGSYNGALAVASLKGQRMTVHALRLRRQLPLRPDTGRAARLRPPALGHPAAGRRPARHHRPTADAGTRSCGCTRCG